MQVDKRIIDGLLNLIKDELFNEKWITIHPHGSAEDENGKRDYRRIKLEDGETPKEAIERVYGKNDKNKKDKEEKKEKSLSDMSVDELKAKKKALWTDLMKKYNNPKDPKKVIPLAERKQYLADVEKIDEILKGKANKDTKDVKKVEKPVKEVKKEEKKTENKMSEKYREKELQKTKEERKTISAEIISLDAKADAIRTKVNLEVKKFTEKLTKENQGNYSFKEFYAIQKDKREELLKSEGFYDVIDSKTRLKNKYLLTLHKYNKLLVSKKDIEIAGVKKGKEMTKEQANEGKCNPNFAYGGAYTINCQSCVVAYEARLRGYNVEAQPKNSKEADKLAYATNLAWINPETGAYATYIFDENVKDAKSCYKWLNSVIEPKARYTLEYDCKGKKYDGHIVSVEKDENGNLRIYDPQNGKIINGKEIMAYVKKIKYKTTSYGIKIPRPPKLMKISDYEINPDIANFVLKSYKG